MDDIIVLNKPRGISSNHFLTMVKKKTGIKKVGHAGTLDPLAEGVLVVGLGKGTKKLNLIIKNEKEYEATIRLGVESTTDDEEGKKTTDLFQNSLSKQLFERSSKNEMYPLTPTVISTHHLARRDLGFQDFSSPTASRNDNKDVMAYDEVWALSRDVIEESLKKFIGMTEQMPPIYSAVKYQGREAYKWTREGKSVELKPRLIEIKEIEILEYQWPFLKIRVVTGPGVYIRGLARDLGRKLLVGGYLSALKRTRVGEYWIKDSLGIEELESR